jgi:hypothetical protein
VICELIVVGPSQPHPAAMWPASSPSTETTSAGEEKGCGLLILANLDCCWGSHVGGRGVALGAVRVPTQIPGARHGGEAR